MVTAMGVSMGLTAAAISSKGTIAQKERWVPDLLTMDKIGAWAITEPNSGSDAFGSMKATARRDGDEYVLNGSKTFITNGPYADTIVFICKLDEGNDRRRTARSSRSSSTRACPASSSPSRCARWACTRSPTGELFLDRRAGRHRPPRSARPRTSAKGGREGAKATFMQERSGVAAMALGIIEQCLELSVAVRQGPGAVRPAHRRVPAHPGQAGPHGGRPPQRAEPGVPHHRDVAPPATA